MTDLPLDLIAVARIPTMSRSLAEGRWPGCPNWDTASALST